MYIFFHDFWIFLGANLATLETGVADYPNMYGDLLLTPEQEKRLLINDGKAAEEEGIKQGLKLWPKGRVVYELDSRLSKLACYM